MKADSYTNQESRPTGLAGTFLHKKMLHKQIALEEGNFLVHGCLRALFVVSLSLVVGGNFTE